MGMDWFERAKSLEIRKQKAKDSQKEWKKRQKENKTNVQTDQVRPKEPTEV